MGRVLCFDGGTGLEVHTVGCYLAHEPGDDSVEGAVLEPKAHFSRAQGAEVLACLGHHVATQLRTQKFAPS